MAEGYLPFEDMFVEAADVFDANIIEAVKFFQTSHGIAPSGKVDDRTRAELNITARARLQTLRENYPRVGEYALDLHERNILVNIPSAQLETVEFGKVRSRHNVVVGKRDRPYALAQKRRQRYQFQSLLECPGLHRAKGPGAEIPQGPHDF